MATIQEFIVTSLSNAAGYNKGAQSRPAVVLWTDSELLWSSTINTLRLAGLPIFVLGDYAPDQNTGPAIWLKCEIAKYVAEKGRDELTPIVYLPGASRNDLRAIESCPRYLQPLAELQYRGVYWSQTNGKDWTVNAILTSSNGGLGLKVAQDNSTYQALSRVLTAGELLNKQSEELIGRTLDATYFDSLIAPNPTRDVLAWMNNPSVKQNDWSGSRWEVFTKICHKDFGFKPEQDGVITAAEKLTKQEGKWKAVWEIYVDSYASFPGVMDALEKITSPADMFADRSGYPQANNEAEQQLRLRLIEIGNMPNSKACIAMLEAEEIHGERRKWLWSRMGQSPLANALQHLATLVELSATPLKSSKMQDIAAQYTDTFWQVDCAANEAMAAVTSKIDSAAVDAALKSIYVPWLEDITIKFQHAVRENGGFKHIPKDEVAVPGLCIMFVDGLRYDVARRLLDILEKAELKPAIEANWTSIPSVTSSGKAWVSPVAGLIQGNVDNKDFEPCVQVDGKPLSGYNFKKLLDANGWQVLGRDETGDSKGSAWTECGDLDHFGHEHGLKLAKEIPAQLAHITERILELFEGGWNSVRVVTDHGWLLVPGGLPKAELSKFEAETRWGRCAVLKDSSKGTPLTFGWDWCADVQIAMAPGISSYIAGSNYSHGGLSLQESLVPVIEIQSNIIPSNIKSITIKEVSWVGLRCHIEIEPIATGYVADIRTKAAISDSSVAAVPKEIVQGKVSLAIPEDELIGTAAIVVILDNAGNVVQKTATTIGE